ncbi:MAG: zinc-binding dehydrogenase [Polyangiaceae bacterium]
MSLQLRSLVRPDGEVEISLADFPEPTPGPEEVVVRVDAAPINPSDLGVMFARAEFASAKASVVDGRPVVTARVPEGALASMQARIGKAIPVGNEGAGLVVRAGDSPAAQALLGKVVGIYGGGTYAQHRAVAAAACLVLPEGTTAEEGASNFVNPMTVLAMLATMRREGHSAIVHTAAASNLGQMLVKLCAKDGVPLVNVVRRAEHVALLRKLGAEHIVDSSDPAFDAQLAEAIAKTKATLAFDAIGGGSTASRVLQAMEAAASRDTTHYSPYGSTIHKQLYIYGSLDRGPTELNRAYGLSWGIGGWLVSNTLAKLPKADIGAMRARVAAELQTTFASHYTKRLSLAQALDLAEIGHYAKQATGEKFLITPSA